MEFKESNIILRVCDLLKLNLTNLKKENDRIVLIDKNKLGIIESEVYETLPFDELVACASCITSKDSYFEMMVRIFVNDKWSKYFSYGKFCLEGDNLYYDQDDDFSYMHVDEILTKEGYFGSKVQFKLILTNNCKLNLVSIPLRIKGFKKDVDTSNLPKEVFYDVPKLNQNMVPVIGPEMCSATTSCMLLKYKGFNFKDKDSEFEHRYVASLVADNGHKAPTYGNWVFNTEAISAFGITSYVKRLYSWEELKLHLATVGPVGASIQGDTGLYKTPGHLLVVVGYRETLDGTYVLCNDPNINERFGNDKDGNPLFVYYEFPLEVYKNFHKKGVIYVVE